MTNTFPPVLSSSYSSPIGEKTYEEFKSDLKNKLEGRVSSAYLFGSIVLDTRKANDVDVILVKNTSTSFVERSHEFFDLYDLACPIDILVYTPEEFEKLRNSASTGFWKSVNESLDRVI